MQKRGGLIAPEIQAILEAKDRTQRIKDFFAGMHRYDIFVLCEELEDFQIAEVIKALGIPMGIELFEEFTDDRKKTIFECFNKEWMAEILEEMAPDERADFLKYLPEAKTEEILPLVARAERLDIKKLMNYEEGTAGSILTTDYAYLPPNVTVRAAIEKIKLQAVDRETIYYIYVIDENRKLLGLVSLRDLMVAPSHKMIEEIMKTNIVSVKVNDDREVVANILNDYDFLAVPVVDDQERLVGIVTVDDVMDVIEEEATEDIYKLGAAGEYIDYMSSSPFLLARKRTSWLVLLVFVGFISAYVLRYHSGILKKIVALSFFMPFLLGSSGNAGTQSSTTVIRGLATKDIYIKDILKVIRKEVSIGLIVGSTMASLGALMAILLQKNVLVGATVGASMVMTVTLATFLGATLPILFKKLKLDPALMSGPFITSIVDIMSLLIYFKMATIMMRFL